MTLHLNLPGGHHHSHHSHGEQQAEVREARRLLKEKIRNDWEFETLPEWKSSGKERRRKRKDADDDGERVAGFRLHASGGRVTPLGFEPVEWRERQYSSASETDGEGGGTPLSASSGGKGSSVYKFDGPESVGTQLQERKIAKKRKRYTALEEEMQWNNGLSHWMRRRDAWCCARTASEVRLLESDATTTDAEAASSTSVSASSSPRTSTSSTTAQTESSSLATSPDLNAMRSTGTTPTILTPLEILVPIAPPILPNHPVRRKISPSMYGEIYTKIILQSRTPSVPINLQVLVNALIQGWKDDGEWPPKPGPLEKSIGRKKGSGSGIKEGVRRVLRLTGVSEHA